MAYEETLKSVSLDADASIALYTGVPGQPGSASPNSGFQYTFVKVTGAHTAGLATAAAAVDGVLQNKPQVVGQAATVAIFGISMVRAGAAVAAGAEVEVGTGGRAITKASGVVVGKAITASTAADQLIAVLLKV